MKDNNSDANGNNHSSVWIRVGTIAAILAGAALMNVILAKTGPKTKKERPPRPTPTVVVMELKRTSETVIQHAMGTVVPAKQLEIKPQVSGKIEKTDTEFVPGGYFEAGSVILNIERIDYELAVSQMETILTDAEFVLTTELGHQAVAKREWELLGDAANASELDSKLALRKPHLEKAEAGVKAAKAKLNQAKINLDRTSVKAPFNAIVHTKSVDVGAQVSPQTVLAILTGTDEYWVQASIPVDRLKWITFPDKPGEEGSKVIIYSDIIKEKIEGRVIKLLGDLTPQGRMARILVSIKNPPRNTLLLGSFVRMQIMGKAIEDIVKIPRSAIRENSMIWIVNEKSELDIRNADILWRDDENVLLKNRFGENDQLIISDLPTPAHGMAIKVQKEPENNE